MMHCLSFSARRYIIHMYLLFLFRFFLCHGDFSSYFSFASFLCEHIFLSFFFTGYKIFEERFFKFL
jgi:hypothetical protein